jgi:hypothetical protein
VSDHLDRPNTHHALSTDYHCPARLAVTFQRRVLLIVSVVFEPRSPLRPIPDIAVPKLPTPHLLFSDDGSARASAQPPAAGPSRPRMSSSVPNGSKTSEHALEIDDRPYERELTKREKAAVSDALRGFVYTYVLS